MSVLRLLLILPLGVAGCTGSAPDPVVRPPSTALLTVSDLPAGFAEAPALPVTALTSEPPGCAPAMNRLELQPMTAPGVHESRVNFADAAGFARIQEILLRYDDDGAAGRFVDETRGMLASCRSYLLSDGTGPQLQVTVTPAATGVGAAIEARGPGYSVHENLVVARSGPTVILLMHSGPEPVDAALTERLVTTAQHRATAPN
ncbi:sensor domain-containing protein [Actinoplanes palleronii]|uniref:Sensor domain-containing protein n=1 Tax=Actinoplanes palleronii TaxID=113570 RepID=A0ABQ4BN73_9ACTN|nr:sensor domain-containing protein [Actinoplanes palleronii]GIE71741.1 hypothetical protein Apa02nite_078490 [Actinoplanes palleronii]